MKDDKNYIGSQQHFEDEINADYDARERRDQEQIDDRVPEDDREPQQESLGESSEEQKRVPKLVKWAKDGYPPIDLNGQYRHVVELIWHYIDMEKKSTSPTSEPPEEQEELIKLIREYWKFDDNQQPLSSWHDREDLIERIIHRKRD